MAVRPKPGRNHTLESCTEKQVTFLPGTQHCGDTCILLACSETHMNADPDMFRKIETSVATEPKKADTALMLEVQVKARERQSLQQLLQKQMARMI